MVSPVFSLSNSAGSFTGNSMVMASIQSPIFSCLIAAILPCGSRRSTSPCSAYCLSGSFFASSFAEGCWQADIRASRAIAARVRIPPAYKPRAFARRPGLESQLRSELNHTRIAGKHLIPFSEQRIPRRQIVGLVGMAEAQHAVQAARRVLRMIQRIVEIGAQLEAITLAGRKLLHDVYIEAVDAVGGQDVPAGIRQRARLRADELRVGIHRQISDGLPGAVLERRYVAAGSRDTVRVHDHAIAHRVGVQVRVGGALRRYPFGRLGRVDAGNLVIAKYIAEQPILVLFKPRRLVQPGQRQPMTAV